MIPYALSSGGKNRAPIRSQKPIFKEQKSFSGFLDFFSRSPGQTLFAA
jgi:hypothetical protein